MLLIVGVFIYISTVKSAPINDTNISYVLAKVLFYKNAKGQIMVANGPVPITANLAIRDDIFSRINDIHVQVVSIYNESKEMPKSINIYQLIKNEQKPVFVTEVKKRLSRTIKEWWDKLWGLRVKRGGQVKKKDKLSFNMNVTSSDSSKAAVKKDISTGEEKAVEDKKPQAIPHNDTKASTAGGDTSKNSDKGNQESTGKETTEVPKINKSNDFMKVTDSPQAEVLNSLEAYDDFIPNDIYYSVEKKCVNWSDVCDVHTGGLLNMSTSNFNYFFKRPKFSQNGPIIV